MWLRKGASLVSVSVDLLTSRGSPVRIDLRTRRTWRATSKSGKERPDDVELKTRNMDSVSELEGLTSKPQEQVYWLSHPGTNMEVEELTPCLYKKMATNFHVNSGIVGHQSFRAEPLVGLQVDRLQQDHVGWSGRRTVGMRSRCVKHHPYNPCINYCRVVFFQLNCYKQKPTRVNQHEPTSCCSQSVLNPVFCDIVCQGDSRDVVFQVTSPVDPTPMRNSWQPQHMCGIKGEVGLQQFP